MLIRVLHIIDRIIAHNRVLILAAELYSSTTFRLVSKLVAFDREFVSKTNDVANRMQECVIQVFTLVSVRQGEVIAADVLDLVGEEGISDHPIFAVVGAGLVVDKDEVGLGTIGCAVDENAEVDGVPVVCGCLEGIHGVVEVGVARKALTDAKVPTFTTLVIIVAPPMGSNVFLQQFGWISNGATLAWDDRTISNNNMIEAVMLSNLCYFRFAQGVHHAILGDAIIVFLSFRKYRHCSRR
jgi:hypothetical protein